MKVIKKNNVLAEYDEQKIIDACSKSAARVLVKFGKDEYSLICNRVLEIIDEEDYEDEKSGEVVIPVEDMHAIVTKALCELFPIVGQSYKDYRNYKEDFVTMLDEVYKKSQSIMYIGDRENANTDSALVSTQRSLVFNELNKEMYKKFFLTREENQAIKDGYIYIHDMNARRNTMNCSLFDVKEVMTGGFEMGNVWYNEPKSLDVAFDVIGDIVMSAASQQYGGFTLSQIDEVLSPYAQKTYDRQLKKYLTIGLDVHKAEVEALKDVEEEMRQGYQGWEYKFNTVSSSRGDYPFITITFGLGTDQWSKLAAKTFLKVHREGQGKEGAKKPVLFPKLVFLYTEKLHGEGMVNEDLFEEGIITSSKTMYPDWLSLDGDNTLGRMYKEYGKAISPMGCRAFLSPFYPQGWDKPGYEGEEPEFIGRFNLGAISLHTPMILAKSRQENKDFYEVLDYYLEMIRGLHIRTYNYLGEMRASTNPLAYCEGGFLGGHLEPNDKIKPILQSATASFGITALNELQMLYNGKSLKEDGVFALEVMEYINKKKNEYKDEDHILYAIYSTPKYLGL